MPGGAELCCWGFPTLLQLWGSSQVPEHRGSRLLQGPQNLDLCLWTPSCPQGSALCFAAPPLPACCDARGLCFVLFLQRAALAPVRAALPQHGQRAPPHTKVLAFLPALHVPNAHGADRQGHLWSWSQQSLEQGKGSPGEQSRLQGDAPAPQVWGHWEPWCPHSPASPQPCLCSTRSLLPPCAELGLSVMPSRPGSVWSYKNPAPGLPAAPPLRAQLLTPVSAGGSARPRGQAAVCQQPRTSLLFSCTDPP